MDLLSNLALGFGTAFSPINLAYCLVGVTIGTLIGVLPGVGPLVTIALLLPITFGLPPETSVIMLAGIYYGAQYGGSTTAILVNVPGETSSVITCLDGHAMARQGRAGAALAIAAIASLAAGIFGTLLIILVGPSLAKVALSFHAAEYFSLMVLALAATASLVHGSLVKGMLMALIGILLGLIGTDVNSGISRFTFGLESIYEGVNFAVLAIGFFALTEIIFSLRDSDSGGQTQSTVTSLFPTRTDLKSSMLPIARGATIGSLLGVLPGAGPSIASFAAYLVEKRLSRSPERFGNGAIEGVAAPEAANNAAVQASFIPTLTLGIPGSATMAVFLGALLIQGITPGPRVMTSHPELFWGLIASMFIGNILLLMLNLPLVGLWVSLLRIRYHWLYPAILVFSCIGVYSFEFSTTDVMLVPVFGLLGYVLRRLECEPAPFVLGFVLGPMMEENFRRALLVSRGDFSIFISRPISAIFLICALAITLALLAPSFSRGKDRVLEQSE